ncbi:Uncharacterised protein [Serratia marcescens]|nr:Uncharacterised protein [Serratia marcescens]
MPPPNSGCALTYSNSPAANRIRPPASASAPPGHRAPGSGRARTAEAHRQPAAVMHQQRQHGDGQRGAERHRQRGDHSPAEHADHLGKQQHQNRSRTGTHAHRQHDGGLSAPIASRLQLAVARQMPVAAAAIGAVHMIRRQRRQAVDAQRRRRAHRLDRRKQAFQRAPTQQHAKQHHQDKTALLQPETALMQLARREL